MKATSIYTLTTEDMQQLFQSHNCSANKVTSLMNDIFRKLVTDFSQHPEISSKVKLVLQEQYSFALPQIAKLQRSQDGTIKFLFQLEDGKTVETVLLNFFNKHTLCISSQVGCAMGCTFCFTGKQGLIRHLSSHEIIGQYMAVKKWILENNHSKLAIKNIVFMGQGEPLHNIDQLARAINIFTDRFGLGLSVKNITVSTSGYLPGLLQLQKLSGVNLALSLHSTRNEVRSRLIPLNKNYPLEKLIPVLDQIPLRKKQLIEYEYLLIRNLNDNEEEVEGLVNLLKDRPHMLNIIPFNPFPGTSYERPEMNQAIEFAKTCASRGIRVCIRKTKGEDILAACGQLNTI